MSVLSMPQLQPQHDFLPPAHEFPEGFIIRPRTRKARTVCGVGINDAQYMVDSDGGLCPAYQKWHDILHRCYQPSAKLVRAYAGCSMAPEWLRFSAFRDWLVQQPDWMNRQIDKDVRVAGNRVYGPDVCMMLPGTVNMLFTSSGKPKRNALPAGVNAVGRRYKARLSICGCTLYLGTFDTPEQARQAYILAKHDYACEHAAEYVNETKLFSAIMANANRLLTA